MRIRNSITTLVYSVIGGAGLTAYYTTRNSDYGYLVGLAMIVVAAIAGVTMMAISAKQELEQMKIVALQTGFKLLPSKTPMFGDTPPGLFGLSFKSDKYPESADFAQYFGGFMTGEKRASGPGVFGTDGSGITWFILEYQYTDSSYHGVNQQFGFVCARTNFSLPPVSMLANSGGGRLTLVELPFEGIPYNLGGGLEQRFNVTVADPSAAEQLLTNKMVEAIRQLPEYDYAFNGPFIIASLYDEGQANILLSMKVSIEKLIAEVPTGFNPSTQ